jgi:cystathionine beta-lyase
MSHNNGLDRRAFLRNAGMTALVGTVGSRTSLATAAGATVEAANGKFDFDTPYSRIGTDCVKWDQQIRVFGVKNLVAGMGIADMDFKTAPAITKALQDRTQHEVWGYLDMPHNFIDGIVDWNKKRYGISINPDHLVISTGVHPGLIAALKTFSPPGSKVLLLTPTYNGFYGDISYVGCKPEESLLKLVDGRYHIDFEDFERRISHDTNTFILCNPQNPTGNTWSRDDLTRLGEICLRRRVVVLSDEIHCDFVTKGNKYTPFSTLDNKAVVNNSITFKAASKSFGLAAMKCGWFFSDNADYITRVKANHRPDISTMGMIANRAAYQAGEDWLNQLVDYIDGNHDFVESFVRTNMPLVKVVKPQGTYLSWLDVSGLAERIGAKQAAAEATKKQPASAKPVSAETIVERWIVQHARVHVNAGTSYGLGSDNRMRMNIATSRKTLEAALTSMADAMKNADRGTTAIG